MTGDRRVYDVSIVGGGLAGLSLSILLAKEGLRVVLFEKEAYPFHKVCGEYISMESRGFLSSLGVPIDEWSLPVINKLELSAPDGCRLQQTLPLGGFGVSRHRLDHSLMNIAVTCGVDVRQETKVQDVTFANDRFRVETDKGSVVAPVCCGTFGKRSNLDIRWKRSFTLPRRAESNYVGVKYHVRLAHPADTISLHLFKGGYCGISPVEEGVTCLCYLTTAKNLRNHGNDIRLLEQQLLQRNPYLREAFRTAKLLYHKPLTIAQVSFDRKEQVVDHVLLAGDAAGMITPLCGNGMSMALHAAAMSAPLIHAFVSNKGDRNWLETQYTAAWQKSFSRRLLAGRTLQSVFGKAWVSALLVRTLKLFPAVLGSVIRQTHGHDFSERAGIKR